jgi:hypothetical protein
MNEIKEITLPRIITTRTLQKESNKSVIQAMEFFKTVLENPANDIKHRLTAAKAIVDTNLKIQAQLIKEEAHDLNKRLTVLKINAVTEDLDKADGKKPAYVPANKVSTEIDPMWADYTGTQQ